MAPVQHGDGVQVGDHRPVRQLAGAGWYEIKGFAWSGRGSIATVDVTTDGGRTWRQAVLEPPVLDKMLTRFRFRWRWDGEPARIASRAIDATGYVQPTRRSRRSPARAS